MPLNLSDPRLYTIRPFSKPARTDSKDVFRVYLSPTTLLLHKLRSGDHCLLRVSEETEHPNGTYIPVIAWTALEKIQDTVVQTSKALQELHRLKLGDKVSIKSAQEPVLDVQSITLLEIPQITLNSPLTSLDKVEQGHWAWYLELPLNKAEVLCPGMILDEVELKGQKRSFKVEQINHNVSPDALYRFVSASAILLQDSSSSRANSTAGLHRSLSITQDGIGGLTRQLNQLNHRLAAYNDSLQRLKLPSYYRSRRGGVLLYGPPGTGKSLILKKVSEAGWNKVFHLDSQAIGRYGGNVDTAVSRIFADARRRQPSVIVVDRLETLAGKSRDPTSAQAMNITTSLCEEFERLGDSRILVIGATKALSDIDEALRRPGCFEFQLELPIPDSKTRTEILKILTSLHPNSTVPMLQNVGDRTHGFVGADLDKLIQLAVDKATARVVTSNENATAHAIRTDHSSWPLQDDQRTLCENPELVVEVTEADLNNALLEVRPTAMQEVFLETPKVRWTDIGGQHEIKKSLKQAVEWPFRYPIEMARLGIEPKKGLLLYGPPGCSKTLTAAAVATEAGLNFLAVKGAELLSMYVGESERAMREVFRKARAAAPSIIFFDEIDAIGATREGQSQHGGLNVLTTLLNELDGIEILKGVFVLAATNKPEVLDPALMRPGRLDTLLYVGPPNLEARKEILHIRVRKMDVAGDVDEGWLAEKTDGYSGAEIVSVCQRAGYAALEEQERSREMMQVWKRHFEVGLHEVQRQITPEMRARYEEFGRRGGG
ncbi:AAA+-type ATPase [Xylographa bjoerkii]|nr:AAA+-type ATPase [Xylographa bjoerkii]MCJ1394541.1 AAA+-type ATPase [Xylographa bjoerkii]